MLVPILFFSASQSKLPGYILPAVPAGALLVTQYLAARRSLSGKNMDPGDKDEGPLGQGKRKIERDDRKFSLLFAALQGTLCGLVIFVGLSTGSVALSHHLLWLRETYITAAVSAAFALGIALVLLSRAGFGLLRPLTLFAVVVSVASVIRLAAPAIDAAQSARPIAESIQSFSHEPVPIALYRVGRVQQYGLEFYLNRPAQKYEDGNIPAAAHVLVAPRNTESQVAQQVPGRQVSYLTSIRAQKLDLFWVGK
jgi:hypothetical protein